MTAKAAKHDKADAAPEVKAAPDVKASEETMRDKFAACAMQGLCCLQCPDYEHIARMAYNLADAMLKVREEEKV